jgi:hypothetical protein
VFIEPLRGNALTCHSKDHWTQHENIRVQNNFRSNFIVRPNWRERGSAQRSQLRSSQHLYKADMQHFCRTHGVLDKAKKKIHNDAENQMQTKSVKRKQDL